MADVPIVFLEPLRPDHATEMFAGLADPIGYRFLPDHPPVTLDALQERYDRQAVGRSADGLEIWLNWIVRLRENEVAIGYTQATITNGSALLGYHLFPAFWRRGLGTLAVELTVDRLFSMPETGDVRALVDTRNHGSSALMRKLGFISGQTIAGADHFKGYDSDEYEFVMSRYRWFEGDR